jgi:beta-carotene 15,15'-dioxygenase
MIAELGPRAPSRGLHPPAVFKAVLAATLGVTAVSAVVTVPDPMSIAVVVIVVAVLGIPHGAVDHLVADVIDGGHDLVARRRFLVRYVLAMAGVGLVWVVAPAVALAGFLVLSMHHFGQSDLAYLPLSGRHRVVLQWSRGAFLIGLPLVAHLDAVSPTIARLGGGDPSSWPWLAELWWLWSGVLVLQHLVVGAFVAPALGSVAARREGATVVALAVLFVTSDPLIGFAVYFGLWHSLSHLLTLADVVGTGPRRVRSLLRLAAPMTAVSLGGLAAATAVIAIVGRIDLLVPVVIVAVSMLTVPHMVVVERLWRFDRARWSEGDAPAPDTHPKGSS